MQVFLVHGEFSAQQILAGLIKKRFGLEVLIPEHLEEITLKPGRELKRVAYPGKAAPPIDWADLLTDMESKLGQLRGRMGKLESKTWVEQTELKDRFLELNRNLSDLISGI
jgi:metallo-beta-lactamase family protein